MATEIKKLEILNGIQTTDNYPYGRLRCTRTTELEYKKGRGYRVAHTTTNPKTGRINKPKRSTYSEFMTLYKDEETGYTKTYSLSLNGTESIQRFINFLKIHENDLEFSEDESQDLWASVIASIKIGAKWTKFKPTPEGEELMALQYIKAVGTSEMIKLYKEKASIKELADWKVDLVEVQNSYTDENGEAIMGFRISNGR